MRRFSRMVVLGRPVTALAAGVAVAAALCAAAAPSLADPVAVATAANSDGTPVGGPPALPLGAHDTGLAPSSESVAFDVVLAPRNQAAVDAFVAAVSTPGSPSYQQFLAPGEFATRFGPTPATIARVSSGLASLGLTVGEARGSIVPVSGTVSAITAALHTSFRHYVLASGRVVRTNDSAPRLPTAFAGAVQGIVGLDDLAQFRHPAPPIAAAPAVDPAVDPAVVPDLSGPTACSAASTGSGSAFFTAPQLASYYGFTSSYTAGTRGAGISVAIFELEPFLASDITAYKTCYGVSTAVSTTDIDGGPGAGAGSAEAALDIEDIIGLAPDASVHVYQGPTSATGTNVLDVYNQIAVDDSTQVVSTSWGACEANSNTAFTNGERAIFQTMAAQGQTIFAASGDAGSADCDTNPAPNTPPNTSAALAVDDPASQPEVTGVGGTSLAGTAGPETVWNDGFQPNGGGVSVSAGGGGVSSRWQMPSWQSAPGVVSPNSSGTPCSAATGLLCREVPDVSASADPAHGYRILYSGSWFVVGGTSASAPTWAALIGLVDSRCGQRVGFLNPTLYQLRTAGSADFHDITSGNNDGAGAHAGLYPATTGYDMASGLGSPIGSTLAAALCPSAAPDGKGSMTVAPANVGVATHNTLVFTYLPPTGQDFINGALNIVVPPGWSAPSTTAGSAGYTTASAGVVSVGGSSILVSGVSAAVNGAVTITYGDTSGGGAGALAPASVQTSTFTSSQQATMMSGALSPLTTSPKVAVGTAADGTGTLTVSPTTAIVSAPNTLQFVYTPPPGTGITNGKLWITVPAGWTTPQLSSNATAGFVTATTGTVSVSGQIIKLTGLSLAIGGSVTVTYGDVSANSAGAAIAPSAPTTSIFAASLQATASGTLTPLAAPPSVVVSTSGGGGGGGGGGGSAPPPPLTLVRIAGADRIGTSVAAAQIAFPTAGSAAAITLVRSDAFADALAGTPFAVAKHGPLLLTATAALDPAVSAEIRRALAPGGTVYLLGGSAALSRAVANAAAALGSFNVVRIAGPDRFTTATLVANMLGPPTTIFEADGTTFADALSAGTAAAAAHGVVVLTSGAAASTVTASYLAANGGAKRYAIGGPAANADRSATAFVGTDRFATSVLVAQAFFPTPTAVGLASGVAFPDALAGGAVAAGAHGPIVLVPAFGVLPASVAGYLTTAASNATAAWLFGGETAISPQVFDQAAAILSGS